MRTQLRLIASNPQRAAGHLHAGAALHALALCLVHHVQNDRARTAHEIAEAEALTPIEIGIVSTWMVQAGIVEAQILSVLTGAAGASPKATPRLSA
jgi:hypothetical protein